MHNRSRAGGERPCEAIKVSLLPSPPVIAAGLRAMLEEHPDHVVMVPISAATEVVLAYVTPSSQPVAVPKTEKPTVVLVHEVQVADTVVSQGATTVSITVDDAALLDAIFSVCGRRVMRPRSARDDGLVAALSVREAEVIRLICQGLTNTEIADRTYLSINSVKTYIRTAYRKIGVTRRAEAVVWGLRHGYNPHSPVRATRERSDASGRP